MRAAPFKKTIIPKAFYSLSLHIIDSFAMFKNQAQIDQFKANIDRTAFMISEYELVAALQDDNSLQVQFSGGVYIIKVERKATNFGGHYYFFNCPQCSTRMRKLYCIDGRYLCRKKTCGNLGYYSQKLNMYDRLIYMKYKIEDALKNRGGSLDRKPPWMKRRTHQKLHSKYQFYDYVHFEMAEAAFAQELKLNPVKAMP